MGNLQAKKKLHLSRERFSVSAPQRSLWEDKHWCICVHGEKKYARVDAGLHMWFTIGAISQEVRTLEGSCIYVPHLRRHEISKTSMWKSNCEAWGWIKNFESYRNRCWWWTAEEKLRRLRTSRWKARASAWHSCRCRIIITYWSTVEIQDMDVS